MQAPSAPDPYQTAAAQSGANKDTAVTQTRLNAMDQITPWGSMKYTETAGADGTPKFTATTSLDPRIQGVVDQSLKTMQQPFSLSNDATESRLMELGRQRLDPMLAERRASTEQDLFNRGARPGSTAYDRAMRGVSQGENDAYNQLLLSGRGQAINEAMLERQTPMNEAIALMTGGQSGYMPTPQSGVAPTDVAGPIMQNYQSQMQQYNAGMSGLFGLGSAALGGWMMSDRRLKEDVHKVGETGDGIPVKTFRYKGSPMMQLGMMAQDVEKKRPEAVRTTPSGYKAVNYPMAMGA